MKYLYIFFFWLISFPVLAQDNSSLYIKCPKDWKIAINGYTQNIAGTDRNYTFNYPVGQQGTVKVLAFTDDSPNVLYSGEVTITGGLTVTLDIRPESDKKDSIGVGLKTPVRPNFGIFDKTEKVPLKKPNFSAIIGISVKEDCEPKKVNSPQELTQIQGQPQTRYYPQSYQNCPT